jgi:hypothetical protein
MAESVSCGCTTERTSTVLKNTVSEGYLLGFFIVSVLCFNACISSASSVLRSSRVRILNVALVQRGRNISKISEHKPHPNKKVKLISSGPDPYDIDS